MNPGKVVDPYRLDEHLKLGASYNPPRPEVAFSYPEDKGDFAHAALRCVGVGKCRTPDGVDVMCPSYIVTREEMHSTRGRARLLFEMLQGEVVTDGWRSREVKEALDLCLACKGCTNDCPVNVDMPTYKAEFLHHHWAGRLRPRHAYAFGLIDQAARIASRMPGLVNALSHTPPFSDAFKLAAGLTRSREVPAFAPLTLQDWFRSRPVVNPHGPRVILWPDTFNNYFHTDVGVAAVEGLEAAWLPRRAAAGPRVLRTAALRLRLPRPGEALPAPHARDAPRRYPRRRTGGRDRAELPGRLQGRAAEAPPARRRRRAAAAELLPLLRVPEGAGRGAATARGEGAPVGTLPPQGDRWDRPRARSARAGRAGGRGGHRRVLRACRLVGIRGRPLRDLDAGRRARAAARRAEGRGRHADRRERLLVQDPDRAGRHRAARAPPRAGAQARPRGAPGGGRLPEAAGVAGRRTGRAAALLAVTAGGAAAVSAAIRR